MYLVTYFCLLFVHIYATFRPQKLFKVIKKRTLKRAKVTNRKYGYLVTTLHSINMYTTLKYR